MITRRSFNAALLFCLAGVSHAQTVNVDQLWVPQSYLRHLPRLYDAAQRVDASSRCAEFITGTVAVDRSRLEHPVFTFTCRDHNRHTYALLVDGLTLHKLDDTRPEGFVSFDDLEREYQRERALAEERQQRREELARLRAQRQQEQEEQQRRQLWLEQEQQRAERLWETCWEQLQERVGNMAELVWLTEAMPTPVYDLAPDVEEPEVGEQPPVVFVIDFDARDIAGQALRYRAWCTATDADEYQLDIKARYKERSPASE